MTAKDFMALFNAGKFGDAQKMLEDEKEKSKFAPNEVTLKDGKTTFRRRGKKVEQDAKGNWRLKK